MAVTVAGFPVAAIPMNAASSDAVSLPKGGGALQGIGEKFAPDLHTGTGNFTVPLAIKHLLTNSRTGKEGASREPDSLWLFTR
jgi:hypothetical protein